MNNISKNVLNDDKLTEIQEVRAAISKNKDKSMHVRYMAIYHHLQGKLNVEIANMFTLCEHTVGVYIKKYKTKGLDALIPAPKSGAPRMLTSEQEKQLIEVVTSHTPDEVGFPSRKNWNVALINHWVYNHFRIQYSPSGMLKLLHRLNLSYTRPTYVLAKADSQKQKAFALEFEVLKKAY